MTATPLLRYYPTYATYSVPSSLLPYTNIRNVMIFKRMRNDQCSDPPKGSIKLSAVPPGSPSRTRTKMPMVNPSIPPKTRGKMPIVNPSILRTCFQILEAKFSAAMKAPTWIETGRTSDALHARQGSTKTIPSTVNPQRVNGARLASSRKTAQE